MLSLRQSSATQIVLLGPFVDDTDGKTPETALSIANTDIKLRKHAGTTFTNKNSGGATHIANGYYYATLDATDTNTFGQLDVVVNMSGALPVRHSFMVLASTAFDTYMQGATPDVNLTSIAGFSAPVTNFANDYNGTGYNKANSTIGNVTNVNDADLATAAALATVDSIVDAILVDTGTTIPAQISALPSAPSAASVADAVWDEAQSAHVTAGTFGELATEIAAILVDTGTTLDGKLNTIDTNVDSILVDTGTTIPAQITALNDPTAAAIADAVWTEAIADHSGTAGSTAEALAGASAPSASAVADAVWDEALSGHAIAGSAGEALSAAGSGADAATIADAVWNEAQADHVAAGSFGEIATEIASILADTGTDGVALTTAAINAIADQVWDETLSGHAIVGSTGEALDAAGGGVTAAAIADAVWDELQSGHVTAGSFGEIASEIASILTDTGTTLPASIAALNDIDVASILAGSVTEPVNGDEVFPMTVEEALAWMVAWVVNKKTLNRSTGAGVLRNQADSGNLLTWTDSDDGTTYTAGVKS